MCFIIDAYSRMIVGWRVTGHMKREKQLDNIEVVQRGIFARVGRDADAGSQFTSIGYGVRCTRSASLLMPSIGSGGDSFDNALAETVNGDERGAPIEGQISQDRGKPLRSWNSQPLDGCTDITITASADT